MATDETRRRDDVATGGDYHSKFISNKRLGLRLAQCGSPTAARRALKRLIVRIALAGILSPQLATRLLTRLGLVSA
jgi:hypothetical protein